MCTLCAHTGRTVRLMTYEGQSFLVMLFAQPGTEEHRADLYTVRRLEDGKIGLTKRLERDEPVDGAEYTVAVGAAPSCDCPGWTNRRKCRHVDALAALRRAGKI